MEFFKELPDGLNSDLIAEGALRTPNPFPPLPLAIKLLAFMESVLAMLVIFSPIAELGRGI